MSFSSFSLPVFFFIVVNFPVLVLHAQKLLRSVRLLKPVLQSLFAPAHNSDSSAGKVEGPAFKAPIQSVSTSHCVIKRQEYLLPEIWLHGFRSCDFCIDVTTRYPVRMWLGVGRCMGCKRSLFCGFRLLWATPYEVINDENDPKSFPLRNHS